MSANWTPKSQLQRGFTEGEWFLIDGSTKLAVIKLIEHGAKREKLFLALNYDVEPANRTLIGFFPRLDLAAEITWKIHAKATADVAAPAPVPSTPPAAQWHPIQNSRAVEWVLQNSPFDEPYGLIRKLEFGHGSSTEVWYRLVTWSTTAAGRELLGYSRDPRALAKLAWDTMIARNAETREAYGRVAGSYASARRPTVGSKA